MSDVEVTAPQQRIIGKPFRPGQSGNPAGRPKGARSRLSEDFLREMADDFAVNGRAAIEAVRKQRPDVYVRVIADLLPREAKLDVSGTIDVSAQDFLLSFRAAVAAAGTMEIPKAPMRLINAKSHS